MTPHTATTPDELADALTRTPPPAGDLAGLRSALQAADERADIPPPTEADLSRDLSGLYAAVTGVPYPQCPVGMTGHDAAALVRRCHAAEANAARLRARVAELEEEVAQQKKHVNQTISGFRSVIADEARRIGPARLPSDIRAALEQIYRNYNAWTDKSAEAERDRLRAVAAEVVAAFGPQSPSSPLGRLAAILTPETPK